MLEIAGSEYEIDADVLLIAAGFVGCEDSITQAFGIEKSPRGCAVMPVGNHGSSIAGLFVAGDMHRGQSLVVHAINEGRHAVREIDEYLMGYSGLA